MNILLLCPFPPLPADSGGAIRVWNLMRCLAKTDNVDLVSPDAGTVSARDREELAAVCRSVTLVPWPSRAPAAQLAQWMRIAWRSLRGEPLLAKYADCPGMPEAVRRVSAAARYDIVCVEHSHAAGYLDWLAPGHGAATVLTMHNVAALQYRRMLEAERNPLEKVRLFLTSQPMRRWEPRMAARFDGVVTMSEVDRAHLRSLRPSVDSVVIPNGVDTAACRPSSDAAREPLLLLIGSMGYAPNVDAALWFAGEMFPRIRAAHPECALLIAGRNPPPRVQALAALPGVRVDGDVAAVSPLYAKARVALAPLRAGGGTRLKILEAMAYGVPVVSTAVGCEGLDARPGEDLLVADAPADFAVKVGELLSNPGRAARLAARARTLVEERYDWTAIAGRLRAMFAELTNRRRP